MTLEGLVKLTYPSPEWVVFFEVGNTTGFGTRRHADAVALGVWQSRGFTLVGFEFKEHRSDWLREKKNPEKAEAVSAHCDCWFVVAGHADVVRADELPEPWGLYVANEDRTKLKQVKTCTPFPDRDKTVMKRGFAAAMLRKVGETTVPAVELDRLVNEALQDALARSNNGHELKHLRDEVKRQRDMVQDFKTRTGVDIAHWQGHKKIGAAVDLVLRGQDQRHSLSAIQTQLEHILKDTKKAIASWPELSVAEPLSIGAVDPVAPSSGDPSTRDKSSSSVLGRLATVEEP